MVKTWQAMRKHRKTSVKGLMFPEIIRTSGGSMAKLIMFTTQKWAMHNLDKFTPISDTHTHTFCGPLPMLTKKNSAFPLMHITCQRANKQTNLCRVPGRFLAMTNTSSLNQCMVLEAYVTSGSARPPRSTPFKKLLGWPLWKLLTQSMVVEAVDFSWLSSTSPLPCGKHRTHFPANAPSLCGRGPSYWQTQAGDSKPGAKRRLLRQRVYVFRYFRFQRGKWTCLKKISLKNPSYRTLQIRSELWANGKLWEPKWMKNFLQHDDLPSSTLTSKNILWEHKLPQDFMTEKRSKTPCKTSAHP